MTFGLGALDSMMYVCVKLDRPVQKKFCTRSVAHADEPQVLSLRNSHWVGRNMLYGYLWGYERE